MVLDFYLSSNYDYHRNVVIMAGREYPSPLTFGDVLRLLATQHEDVNAQLTAIQQALHEATARPLPPDYIPQHEVPEEPASAACLPAAGVPTILQEGSPAAESSPEQLITDTPTKRERAPRHCYSGIFGADPRFHVSVKTHTLIMEAPFAIHHDEHTTQWITLVLYGEKAAKLRDISLRGVKAEVIGGDIHPRQVKQKDGTTRTRLELNTYALTLHDDAQ
jgi:hypothetical protein